MIGNTNMHTPRTGFTLVEVLIATAVMSIVMVLASNLLILFFKSQDTSRDTLYLEAEMRQIFSRIVETSREGRIDYDFYTTTPDAEPNFLAFRTTDGEQTVYQFYTPVGSTASLYVCANMPIDDTCDKATNPETSSEWAQMNPTTTDFSVGRFGVQPDDPPYLSDATLSDVAPVVTIVTQMEITDSSSVSPVLQTSITPRMYAR